MTPIETWDNARVVTREDLIDRNRPLLLRSHCADWPLVAAARRSDTDFARALAAHDNGSEVDVLRLPPEADGVIGYSDDLQSFNYDHFRVSVTDVLKRLATYSRRESPPGLALQSALIASCLPGLLPQLSVPPVPENAPPRLWIGNRVTTPAHFDEYHNLACVVCGVRRFTLFAPDQARNLYLGPLDYAPTGAAIGVARLDQPNDPRYPRLREALAHAQVADLQPGDAIYIPPLWFHHVASLEPLNALVNTWWKSPAASGAVPDTGLAALMHAVLAFKSLPPAERAGWRDLLDYYALDENDPAAHLPPERRGILGELTPELAEQLKARIRRYL